MSLRAASPLAVAVTFGIEVIGVLKLTATEVAPAAMLAEPALSLALNWPVTLTLPSKVTSP